MKIFYITSIIAVIAAVVAGKGTSAEGHGAPVKPQEPGKW